MRRPRRRFTPTEDAIVQLCRQQGMTRTQTAQLLPGRTTHDIGNRIQRMDCDRTLLPPLPGDNSSFRDIDPSLYARRQDRAFKLAMIGAVKAGEEHAPFGVLKDRRPPSVRACVVKPAQAFSGCGSSSALCAELGAASDQLTYV